MATLKVIPEIGDIAKCKKGYIGMINEIKDEIYYGFHLGRMKFGKPWQSSEPTVIGNIYDYLKDVRDK